MRASLRLAAALAVALVPAARAQVDLRKQKYKKPKAKAAQRAPERTHFGVAEVGPPAFQKAFPYPLPAGELWYRHDVRWSDLARSKDAKPDFSELDRRWVWIQRHVRPKAVVLGFSADAAWAVEPDERGFVDPRSGRRIAGKRRLKEAKAYRAWITAIAERYDGDGNDDMPGLVAPLRWVLIEPRADEVWDLDGYLDLLAHARRGVRGAGRKVGVLAADFETGPTAAAARRSFASSVMGLGGKNFDVAGAAYTGVRGEDPAVELRAKMGTSRKPVWVTRLIASDLAAAGADDAAARAEQAKELVKRHVRLFRSGVDVVILAFGGADPARAYAHVLRGQGLIDEFGDPKPAYATYATLVAKLDRFEEVEPLDYDKDVEAYRFYVNEAPVVVAWAKKKGEVPTFKFDTPRKWMLVTPVVTQAGEAKTEPFKAQVRGGRLSIPVSDAPVFIEEIRGKER